MAEKGLAKVAISITSLDRKLSRAMEPRAATPGLRLKTIRDLNQQGIPISVMVAPVIPALNDHEVERILDSAQAAGAREAGFVLLRLPREVSPLFRDWLLNHYPDRYRHVMNLLRAMRGGKDYDAEFGKRMRGDGPYAWQIGRRFELACGKLSLNETRRRLTTDLFIRPKGETENQLSLFLSQEITRYETTPGRKVQPVAESSFDAWIKLYRQDANSPNCQISYYLKGELVSLLLDLMIRSHHQNQRSLDDVMVRMWEQFGKEEIGYTPQQLQGTIESVAGIKLADFFDSYIHSTQDLPFNEYLEPFGLQLVGNTPEEPYLGIKVKKDGGKETIKFVEAGSPAQVAGIDSGDELLAIDGVRVSASQLKDRLQDYQSGDTIQATVFHQDVLRTYSVTLSQPISTQYYLQPLENPTPQQQENFMGWLGVSIKELIVDGKQ
ncbi:MAG: PDZ domain-containing protein, partial [Cyanobacteria bacterium P01_A01_bin.68]